MEWASLYDRAPSGSEGAVLDAFHRRFVPSGRVHIHPNVAPAVVLGACGNYLRVQVDELVIAVFDETLLYRNAADGFAFTTRRVYWKNQNEPPRVRSYEDLRGLSQAGGLFSPAILLGDGLMVKVNMAEVGVRALIVSFLENVCSVARGEAGLADGTPWNLAVGGQQRGPYDAATVRQMVASGQLDPSATSWTPRRASRSPEGTSWCDFRSAPTIRCWSLRGSTRQTSLSRGWEASA
jgi:hypothetical protein